MVASKDAKTPGQPSNSRRPGLVRLIGALSKNASRHPCRWSAGFFSVYSFMFWFVEHAYRPASYHLIDTALDHAIPLVEAFIVPYLLWFPYWIVPIFWFAAWALFRGRSRELSRYVLFLSIGMSTFIVVSLAWPNGLALRPDHLPRDNVFSHLLAALWSTDSPENVLPSVHVYDALAAHIAILACEPLKKSRHRGWVVAGSWVLCVSIIAGTLFLKQHSVIDVGCSCALAALAYQLVYGTRFRRWAARVFW